MKPMNIPFVSFLPMEHELDAELRTAFERVYRRSFYIAGPEDSAFEEAFAAYCGANYCVGCGNGLDALLLILKAYGIGEGDEVIVPSNTYIATALAVSYAGAVPVLVEPRRETFNLDPAGAEAAITPRTKAIMAVHLYGQTAEMTELRETDRGCSPGPWRPLERRAGRCAGRCGRIQLLPRQKPGCAGRCRLCGDQRQGAGRKGSSSGELWVRLQVPPHL